MKVNEIKTALTSEPVASVEMYPEPANQDDIHWFSSQLNNSAAPDSPAATSGTSGVTGRISDALSDNLRAQKEALHDLSVASKSSKPEDFSKANAQLSNYYIESLMSAKVISKGVQSLDKLTNLQ